MGTADITDNYRFAQQIILEVLLDTCLGNTTWDFGYAAFFSL